MLESITLHDVWLNQRQGKLARSVPYYKRTPSKVLSSRLWKNVSRSNPATANEIRDYRIFEELSYEMIAEARRCCQQDAYFALSIDNLVYAFDSTLIDLCLNVFWWAEFRKA